MEVKGQDPQFSQVFTAPLYLNPALTGNTGQDRVAMTHRRQWMGLTHGYVSSSLSYDHNFRKKKVGVGFSMLKDQAGIQGLQFTEFAGTISKDLSIGPFNGFRLGMKLAQTTRSYDLDKLVFWDQLYSGGDASNGGPLVLDKIRYFDTGSGLLYYSQKFWGGINVNHLNRPVQSFLGSDYRMDMKFSLHAGADIPLQKRGSHFPTSSIQPVIIYKFQQDWNQLDVGAYYQEHGFRIGCWYRGLPIRKKGEPDYRNNDALVIMLGAEMAEQWQLGYSYDITLSNLTMKSGGSHEISLIYEWPRSSKYMQKRRPIPCPRF